jgi:hypothetical protein
MPQQATVKVSGSEVIGQRERLMPSRTREEHDRLAEYDGPASPHHQYGAGRDAQQVDPASRQALSKRSNCRPIVSSPVSCAVFRAAFAQEAPAK